MARVRYVLSIQPKTPQPLKFTIVKSLSNKKEGRKERGYARDIPGLNAFFTYIGCYYTNSSDVSQLFLACPTRWRGHLSMYSRAKKQVAGMYQKASCPIKQICTKVMGVETFTFCNQFIQKFSQNDQWHHMIF